MGSQIDEDHLEEVSEEVFARRAQARQRQITIGKSRPEYKIYAGKVPYHVRDDNMPQTPDPHARISKRAFDRELACWRRGLHVCSAELEPSMADGSPQKEWGPGMDWTPGTESTRADSEASSPTRSHCPTPGHAGAKMWNGSNVKLNLFEHLSPPLPPQTAVPAAAAVAGSSPQAMAQMVPAMPQTGGWDMYAAGMNPATMMGVMSPGTAPCAMQYAPVDQQQCGYAMAYSWGEPISPWTPAQQQFVAPPTAPLQVPALPTDPTVGVVEAPVPQPMWNSISSPPRPLPGTPRASKNSEETPSTPLNKVVRSAASPAVPTSPWLRTPSPDHGHYNMTHFKASQQQPQQPQQQQQLCAPSPAEADPFIGTTLMVVTRSYFAESDGYLSVAAGSQLRAMIDNPHCGDAAKCAWPTYVYCSQGAGAGWVPQQLLWRCYADDAGRRWACDDSNGAWCWVDEIEKNAA